MADVKQPEDHKEKATKPKVERVDDAYRVEHRGIRMLIPVDALDDFELLEDLATMQNPDVPEARRLTRTPAVFRRLFGAESSNILDRLRDPKSGRVKINTAATFLFEVFGALRPES